MAISEQMIRKAATAVERDVRRRAKRQEERRLEEEALTEYVEASLSIRYSEGTVKGVRLG
jgi:hypothetical protein